MEIIKLRAWNSVNKKMSFWTMNDLCTWDEKEEKPSALYNWTRYTGLKDKANKEIYEHDFIQTKNGLCKVVWSETGACFVFDFGKKGAESPVHYESLEVKGNIYETPELLTKIL